MLGAIIGDIVGSRFEFDPTNNYDFELFHAECNYTDDSICTIAVADALLQEGDFGDYLHRWCRRYPHPMGGYGNYFVAWVHSDNPQPYYSFGNGSAMRVSAVGWFYRNGEAQQVIDAATASAACTHNHPEGIKGAVTVALAIYDCLRMHQQTTLLSHKNILEIGLQRALDYSGYDIDSIDIEYMRNRFEGSCQGTVPVALKIILQSNSFEDAIRQAVALGADADTLGAIVGSIAEAIWGIPEWMKKEALSYLPQEIREVLYAFNRKVSMNPTKQIHEAYITQKAHLRSIFDDTMQQIEENIDLSLAQKKSISEQLLVSENMPLVVPEPRFTEQAVVCVTHHRSFEAAALYKGQHVAVLNFASSTTPGGGVTQGASAQEESLCRCSTLYGCLNTYDTWKSFYMQHRHKGTFLANDDLIYTPDVVVLKDDDYQLLAEPFMVDVITCAAPNLRQRPYKDDDLAKSEKTNVTPEQLFQIHEQRAHRILSIAAIRKVDTLILGAFGCGAFRNDPKVVTDAYLKVLPQYLHHFRTIEFAVYCPPDNDSNYQAFKRIEEELG